MMKTSRSLLGNIFLNEDHITLRQSIFWNVMVRIWKLWSPKSNNGYSK